MADGTTIIVDWTANLRVKLRTIAGFVHIAKPVECLIIPGDSGEFLLGNDLLLSLGIDVEQQIDMLAVPFGADTDGDEFDDPDEPTVEGDKVQDVDVRAAVLELVDRAIGDGFPCEWKKELMRIALRFDLWRIRLGADPPARVPPMRVRFKAGARPYRCKARKYSPEVRRFLEEFNNKLVQLGWVYENRESRWASPVLPVRKSTGEFRQTADYKPVNALVEAIVGIMPDLQTDLEAVKGAAFFGLFDFIKGYWQLALAEECQEMLSYMTHNKVYTPTRVPQGCTDAALFFQATIQKCLEELLHRHLLVWIDDLLLFANDVQTYLQMLERMFELLDFFGFKLSVKKSCLFRREVRWCGKIITGSGVRHDPERVRTLQELPYPKTAAELQQFLCATNWMRDSLVDYARTTRPLQDAFDKALASATKRAKRVAAGIAIGLSAEERAAFDAVKKLLANSVKLAFPRENATMCLMSDASDVGWSLIVSQVVNWKEDALVHEQQHELLVCLSGTFTGAQCHWSIIEKEAYPIVCACDKLGYLLLRPGGFQLYCDHRNLIYVFAPGDEIKKHIRGKLLRWASKLTEFKYEIAHIDGTSNLCADMCSRWAGNHTSQVNVKQMTLRQRAPTPTPETAPKRKRVRRKEKRATTTRPNTSPGLPRRQPIRPLSDPEFQWPSRNKIVESQIRHQRFRPTEAIGSDVNGWTVHDRMWIPDQEEGLIQRILVIAHCGHQGHRGRDATMESIKRFVHLVRVRARVEQFLSTCLLCHHVKGAKVIQRPWGETYRTNERNGALHWDFLSLGDSFAGDRYLSVLKDEATHFCELTPCSNPTSTVAVEAILAWHSRYGIPPLWISDQGSHFKNAVVAEVCRRLKSRQDFTVAYSPWINGSIERANRDIIQVLRVLCLEYEVDTHDWTFFVPILQGNLNHTPVPPLGNRAPVELFCGLPLPSPLDFCMDAKKRKILALPEQPGDIEPWLATMKKSIRAMHKPMSTARAQQTESNKRRHDHAKQPNFDVGDYVLRSRVDSKHQDKLLVTWIGPYQVARADSHSFRVRHLVTGDETDVHASRLKFYADSSLEISEEIREHVAAQGQILTVESLLDYQWNAQKKDYDILVSWKGLESIEDSWESSESLAHDIPALLKVCG